MKSNKHRDPTMTRLYTVLLFLTVLFLVVDAKGHKHKHKDKLKKIFHRISPHPKHTYTNLFPSLEEKEQAGVSDGGDDTPEDYETNFLGSWEVINRDSGVSAMQIQLMPDNTMNVYDATVYRVSRLRYPEGMPCVQFYDENLKQNKQDCYAHAMTYDIQTNQVRALTVRTIHISSFLTFLIIITKLYLHTFFLMSSFLFIFIIFSYTITCVYFS